MRKPSGNASTMASDRMGRLPRTRARFAGREAAVERAFGASAPFRDLCRDYLACVAALERWQGSKSREALLRTAEYSDLKDELTREIEVRLGAHER